MTRGTGMHMESPGTMGMKKDNHREEYMTKKEAGKSFINLSGDSSGKGKERFSDGMQKNLESTSTKPLPTKMVPGIQKEKTFYTMRTTLVQEIIRTIGIFVLDRMMWREEIKKDYSVNLVLKKIKILQRKIEKHGYLNVGYLSNMELWFILNTFNVISNIEHAEDVLGYYCIKSLRGNLIFVKDLGDDDYIQWLIDLKKQIDEILEV